MELVGENLKWADKQTIGQIELFYYKLMCSYLLYTLRCPQYQLVGVFPLFVYIRQPMNDGLYYVV